MEKGPDVVMFDKTRVWSTGTDMRAALAAANASRDKIAKAARVANQHAVHWRSVGEYKRALPCIHDSIRLNASALGKEHMFYATCLNNLAATLEAMGLYDQAMKKYKESLAVTEKAAPGTFRVYLISGRHLPHAIEEGDFNEEGKWESKGKYCDPFMTVTLDDG
ncbi:hypothetical protein T484DRAFT_1764368 [Baffinella frigidus]|nr:hypothetical protein T484DRAFT_1764368 [Cryptophyta sp. CCMP2293]